MADGRSKIQMQGGPVFFRGRSLFHRGGVCEWTSHVTPTQVPRAPLVRERCPFDRLVLPDTTRCHPPRRAITQIPQRALGS